jgi:hypothetical protein
MLINAKHLKGLTIRATDGELGTVDQFYFDDESWGIRYLVVDTSSWLSGRQVLIASYSILEADWESRHLDVGLTMKQVEESPDINTHLPVSRQHEAVYLAYYGYPYYWNGPDFWSAGLSPVDVALPVSAANEDLLLKNPMDIHLRSSGVATGYELAALDGEIGHVDGFVVDDESWAVRYIEVATRNWWPGKKVLISPAWVSRISWSDSKLYVSMSREAVQTAPEYREDDPITREFENQLYVHYGESPYWLGLKDRDLPL